MFNFLVFDCIFANALKNILLSHNLTHHHAQLNESVQIWLDLSKKITLSTQIWRDPPTKQPDLYNLATIGT